MNKQRTGWARGGLDSDRAPLPRPIMGGQSSQERARSRATAACCLAGLLGAFFWLGFFVGSGYPTLQASQKAEPAGPIEVREIDLSAIYSTSFQKKLEPTFRHLPEKSPERTAYDSIDEVFGDARKPRHVAVVRGENFKEAVLATARLLKLKEPPARPVGPDDRSTTKKCWLFVHIARGTSSGPQWIIYPPTVYGNKVRFTYTGFDGWFSGQLVDTGTTDDNPYFYWVPLGEVTEPGEVKAEMVEFTKTVKASYPAKKQK